MKKIVMIFLCALLFIPLVFVHADELDDITKELNKLQTDLKSKEANHSALTKQLADIKLRVSYLETAIVKKEKEVEEGEKNLIHQKELLNVRARSYYKNAQKNNSIFIDLLISENLSSSLKNFFYQKTVVDQDRDAIIKIVEYIKDLEEKKASLESEKKQLAIVKDQIDQQSKVLAADIEGTRSKIAQLSSRQQNLIAQKLASLNIPRSAGTSARGCSDDRSVDPGFSPRLAFFTYGAPHRNGLNQYGAWGRAKAGQNEEQILSEYFPGMSLKKDYDQGIQIKTDTGWSGSIEDYVKRIYEMPDSWTDNNLAALKAQAVAARTYALHSTGNGANAICTTEACQVFKSDPKGGNWEQAVEATKGWVMMDGGGPGFTQYASTHGGYILNLGKFDGHDGNPSSFGELNDRAYDKDSPWFYCDWGARGEYSNTAWLKTSEVADIANAIMLVKRDGSVGEHLYQPDKPNPAGTDTWSADRVKSELRDRGGSPYNSVDSVSVSADFGSGKTTSVNVSGDAGSQGFDAGEFKNWFNLRAPANVQIVGPLFNVEKR